MTEGGRTPAASVIIAAYNEEDTLGAQLQALSEEHERTPESFEVLVCDNGSTDGTAALMRQMSASLPGLRLIDAAARRGPGAARNIGAAEARGEVLLFCDADDVIAPGWVEALREAAGQADLVAGALEGRSLNRDHRAAVSWEVSSEITVAFWPRYPAGATSNLAVRASAFRAVGGFDEALRTGEDIDLCWRIQIAGYTFSRAPAAVVHSRQREGRRAVFQQAFSYGAGHRALRLKYRHLIDAALSTPAEPEPDESETHRAPPRMAPQSDTASPTLSRSFAAKARRAVLTPAGHANLAWRFGEWLGGRFGHISPDVRPLVGS